MPLPQFFVVSIFCRLKSPWRGQQRTGPLWCHPNPHPSRVQPCFAHTRAGVRLRGRGGPLAGIRGAPRAAGGPTCGAGGAPKQPRGPPATVAVFVGAFTPPRHEAPRHTRVLNYLSDAVICLSFVTRGQGGSRPCSPHPGWVSVDGWSTFGWPAAASQR